VTDPRLVLLRTPGLDLDRWDGVAARMPGFARTVTIDLPALAGADVVPRLAEHVAGELAGLRMRLPHVVGHSLGAAVALELACRVPVAAVTSFCAVGFAEPGRRFFPVIRMRDRYARRYTFPRPERLAGTPVTLVWAERDRVVPPADAGRARAALPHAGHIVMPGCGHLVHRDDQNGTAAVVNACHIALLRDDRRAI
jgi:pimeloyl-ACP methyl ester carboxylesterase